MAVVGNGAIYLSGVAPSAGAVVLLILFGLAVAVVPTIVVRALITGPAERLRETIEATRNDGDLARRVAAADGGETAGKIAVVA
ncbi:MAG TPA: hypothetical protein PK375_10330, partial [Rhodocyclaceae bacterium]|nr:hypothetical protein [Rhodocyclaceae bacterium]